MGRAQYILPLDPLDLAAIYKEKQGKDIYILNVDLEKSLEKIKYSNIMLYLSNTGFTCDFDEYTDDILIEYITSKNLVDSPTLASIWYMIISSFNGINNEDPELYELYGIMSVEKFIIRNNKLVKNASKLLADIALNLINENSKLIKPEYNNNSFGTLDLRMEETDNVISKNITEIAKYYPEILFISLINLPEGEFIVDKDFFDGNSKYKGTTLMGYLNTIGVSEILYNFLGMIRDQH